jgi:hypothetical protein
MRYRILCRWVLSAGTLLLLPGAASAQQAYRLTLREPDKGDLAEYRKVVRFRAETQMQFPPEKGETKAAVTHALEEAHTLAFVQKVLQRPGDGGNGLTLRRRYRQAERTVEGKPQPLPYAGKAVLIEQQEGRYKFRIVGGEELNAAEARELHEEFNNERPQLPRVAASWLLPKAPVRPGESWAVDPTLFLQDLSKPDNVKLQTGKVTATGKLLRAYRKEGRQHGVIEVRIDVPITSFVSAGAEKVKVKASKLTVRMVADACIDGSSFAYRLKGTMEHDFEGTLVLSGTKLRSRFQRDFFESRQEAGKK